MSGAPIPDRNMVLRYHGEHFPDATMLEEYVKTCPDEEGTWIDLCGKLRPKWWRPYTTGFDASHYLLAGGRWPAHPYVRDSAFDDCCQTDAEGIRCTLRQAHPIHGTRPYMRLDALWLTEEFGWDAAVYSLAGGR